MIYTITLNPSADYLMQLPELKPGETNRAVSSDLVSGGKGINVAEVLTNFKEPVTAMGFLAGFTGSFVKNEVGRKGIHSDFIFTEGLTRINVKIKAGEETEINGQGPVISEGEIALLKQKLSNLTEEDLLVLSGSVPAGVPAEFYKEVVEQVLKSGAKTVLDTSGEPLKKGIEANPFLIKPNKAELSALYDQPVNDLDAAITLGKKAVEDGAENVLLSLGAEGALLINKDECFTAKAPKGKLINSVGAGDSMVAGFLYAYANKVDLKGCFQYSVAAGSATAFSQGFCTKEQADELAVSIAVQSI
ncbi:1-phosphofructokinase [Alteribacter keqinensis]|uniref:Tagatose-6-phosphate kinase n=1 Tax=Alteribacter keqinensis TaxID=2483800 RepID=A0A3M7U0C3_9BACI|nr:1-phosphofructokinase [Alteribacter keqinensis]RNA70454.1 1-phosphofructokinase [Alteribacter keqinensis]